MKKMKENNSELLREHLTEKVTDSNALSSSRLHAIMTRDQNADGQFIFAVTTTKIYCRPSCASRRANIKNILFFDTVNDAEKSGFRACLRCKPNELLHQSLKKIHRDKITLACRLLEETVENIPLQELAKKVGLSEFYFHRLFKKETGVTPKQYFNTLRNRKLHHALQNNRMITDAIYAAGFNSSSQFYEKSQELLGMHASDYKNGGIKSEIFFAIATSSLGSVLVAQSKKGVCSILIDDDPEKLIKELQNIFPKAELIGADPNFEATIAKVIGLIEHPQTATNLPLDIQGTIFQKRVWEILQTIPVGQTLTYQDIAKKLGNERAYRAVANACAANKLAIAVPCHRVIRQNGELSGYRWGIERKRELLIREKKNINIDTNRSVKNNAKNRVKTDEDNR